MYKVAQESKPLRIYVVLVYITLKRANEIRFFRQIKLECQTITTTLSLVLNIKCVP